MKANLEKFNHYKSLVDEKVNYFLATIEKPPIVYMACPSGKINEHTIDKIGYSHRFNGKYFYLGFTGKKPTNQDVARVKEYYESLPEFKKEQVLFHYHSFFGENNEYKSSGAHSLLDESKSYNLFTDKQKAKSLCDEYIKIKEFREKHKKDASYKYGENGYKFLGWQNGWRRVYFDEDGNLCSESGKPRKTFGYLKKDYPEYMACLDSNHTRIEVNHNNRGSENTVSCPICKIYWKYDCSD